MLLLWQNLGNVAQYMRLKWIVHFANDENRNAYIDPTGGAGHV
jgi:hypothetical protein